MPNKYTRKNHVNERGYWITQALNDAVNAYRNGEIGVNEAARVFGIPKTTFKRRLKSNNLKNTNRLGPDSSLGSNVEQKLVRHIIKLKKSGFAPTRTEVRIMAYNIAERLGIPNKFNKNEDVTVEYHKGLPQITVPLPSRKERCRFTLKPITNTVGDFLEMLKREDKGIDRVICKSRDGTRIASSNTIESLLDDDFKLIINDLSYNVNTPKQERLTGEEIQRLNDVKTLVSQLYEAMHIQEHQLSKEKDLTAQLEMIQQELLPLEQKKIEIELVAHRKGNWLAWAGLGLMSVQFGILARLTWWEYSWDIMEPVTYFVTYGTAMACYAYYVLTKEEYVLQDVRDRQHLIIMHKKAKKTGLDLNQYNMLKQEAARIQYTLKKLRNPLKLKLPPKVAVKNVAEVVPVNEETKTTVDNKAEMGPCKVENDTKVASGPEEAPKK